eukprot:2621757-Pyramimonas_sp.AAC.1
MKRKDLGTMQRGCGKVLPLGSWPRLAAWEVCPRLTSCEITPRLTRLSHPQLETALFYLRIHERMSVHVVRV